MKLSELLNQTIKTFLKSPALFLLASFVVSLTILSSIFIIAVMITLPYSVFTLYGTFLGVDKASFLYIFIVLALIFPVFYLLIIRETISIYKNTQKNTSSLIKESFEDYFTVYKSKKILFLKIINKDAGLAQTDSDLKLILKNNKTYLRKGRLYSAVIALPFIILVSVFAELKIEQIYNELIFIGLISVMVLLMTISEVITVLSMLDLRSEASNQDSGVI